MHTNEECKFKIAGVKLLSEQLKLEIKERGSAFSIAESITVMCNELLKEFPEVEKVEQSTNVPSSIVSREESLMQPYVKSGGSNSKSKEDYIKRVPNFLSTEECDACLKHFKEVPSMWELSAFYDRSTGNSMTRYSSQESYMSMEDFPGNKEILKKIYDEIGKYQVSTGAISSWSGWSGYSPLRLNRYSAGQNMPKHVDHIYNLFDGDIKGVPILTFIINFNDNYSGGDLIMFDEETGISLKKGELVLFPSNFLYPHSVGTVREGIRYSGVGWVF
mgnify:FL=1